MSDRRKVFISLGMVGVWIFVLTLPAEATIKPPKQINIIGILGAAGSDIDEPLLDIGIEFQLVQGLYVQLVANSYLGSGRDYYYDDYYYDPWNYGWPYPGISLNAGANLYGVSTFGVYKVRLTKKIKLFAQAGLTYMYYRRYEPGVSNSRWRKVEKRGYGSGFGAGAEFYLAEKFGLILGGTYIMLFEKEPQWAPNIPSPGKPSWLKIHIGAFYHLKGKGY